MKALTLPPVRFIFVGVANTIVGLLIIFALKYWLGFNDIAANGLGYGIGFCLSYLLNARWTFSFRGPIHSRISHYALVVVVAYLGNLATVGMLLHFFHWNSYLAQAAGIPPYAVLTYFGSRFFVFKDRNQSTAPLSSNIRR